MKFDCYIQMFSRAFDFKGKSNLKEYWFAVLYSLIFSICSVLIAIPFVIDWQVFYGVAISVSSLYEIVVFIPMLALTIRRLHDANHSYRALLWLLLPFVGTVIILVYLASPSNSNLNLWPFQNMQRQRTQNNETPQNVEQEIANSEEPEKTETLQDERTETEQIENIEEAQEEKLPEQNVEAEAEIKPVEVDKAEDENAPRSERIKNLQERYENGEITEEEYQKKVIEILKR